jgi:hypothetical protein
MEKGKERKLTDHLEGFQQKEINYNDYEISFRRWLISQIDSEKMTVQEARDRFNLGADFVRIIKNWQEKYSDQLHVSLQAMNARDRSDNSKLEKRIKDLEKQLEQAKMKNVALNTMIDIAEHDYKLEIRKKSGPKQ